MSTNYGFEPTLDGLNNIDSDSTTTTNIVCDTITINTSGTAPTMAPGNNTTNIANTAFVTNAISSAGGSYVTLTGTQTVSGQKTFNNFNYFINDGVLGPSSGTLLFEDSLGNGALMYYNNDNTGGLGGLRVVSTSYGFAFSSTFGAGEKCSFKSENISFEAVGGTITFLGAVPSCSIAPTTGNHLCNKTYVDSVSSSPLATNNVWTGTNAFNTSLPTSTLTPSSNTQLTTKVYVDDADTVVFGLCAKLASNNTFTGTTNRFEGLNGVRSGTSTNYASLTQNGGQSILNAFGASTNVLYLQTNGSSNMTMGESGGIKYNINSGDFYNTTGDMFINQTNTTTGMGTTQIGYTVEDTTRSTDAAATQVSNGVTKNILSFTPLKGVWVASFSWKLTANTSGGSGTIGGWEVCLSATTASLTPYRSFTALRELDDALGGSGGVRDKGNLSGVINADGATAYYINANIRFSGLAAPNTVYLAIPMLTYTKIG